ncbi:hypothetical protein JHW43_008831 [Diplocarpon mali]|nr:hypothetical protein JHW43_008831 [Diplocarpon mali]
MAHLSPSPGLSTNKPSPPSLPLAPTTTSVFTFTPAQINALSAFLHADDAFYAYIAHHPLALATRFHDLPLPASLLRALGFAGLDTHLLPLIKQQVRAKLAHMWAEVVASASLAAKHEGTPEDEDKRVKVEGLREAGGPRETQSPSEEKDEKEKGTDKDKVAGRTDQYRWLQAVLEEEIAASRASEEALDEELEACMARIQVLEIGEQLS